LPLLATVTIVPFTVVVRIAGVPSGSPSGSTVVALHIDHCRCVLAYRRMVVHGYRWPVDYRTVYHVRGHDSAELSHKEDEG
jgi:hypothetical protein